MKALLLVPLLLIGCTTVHHRNGSPWISTGSNIAHLEAHSGSESVVIDGLNNSAIHTAAGNTVTKTGMAVATSGLFSFLGPLLK